MILNRWGGRSGFAAVAERREYSKSLHTIAQEAGRAKGFSPASRIGATF